MSKLQRIACIGAMVTALAATAGHASDDNDEDREEHGPHQQDFVHGAPQEPSLEWVIAAGGRIYDNWWEALDRDAPERTNPAYPVSVNDEQDGAGTWRCKECHGWDYKGKDGVYGSGSHYTGIPGVMGAAGKPVDSIAATLRDDNHPYTTDMLSDEELSRVAAFISLGLVDMDPFIDPKARRVRPGTGDIARGRAIFQTICAACHGYDGRALDWGTEGEPAFVGTEASSLPDEVFNKLSNSHPGAAMVNMRAFPLEDRISLLAYIAGLPVGYDD